MNEPMRRILYFIGIIAVLYILFRYILPFLFKVLIGTLGVIFSIIMWVAIGVVVFLLISYIVKLVKNNY